MGLDYQKMFADAKGELEQLQAAKANLEAKLAQVSARVAAMTKAYNAIAPLVGEQPIPTLRDALITTGIEVLKAAGITVATAKTEIAGYDIFSLSDQTSADVLGSGKGTGSSGTAQSLLNNWKVLYAAGVITTAPPASAAAYVNSTYAAEAISST